MRRIPALLVLWALAPGAFYEWGGAAARGVRELKEGKHREAVESLRKGRAELPRSAAVRYNQGIAYRGLGLADSAHAAFRDAAGTPWLEGDPARSSAAYNLGNDAMRAQDYDGAARHYRQALRVDPARVDAKKSLEEAIRRMRNERPRPPGSGGGTGPPSQGKENRGPGAGQRGEPSPFEPPGGGPERSEKGRKPRLDDAVPNRAEAEHWLDALESERRAARQRDRRDSEKAGDERDW